MFVSEPVSAMNQWTMIGGTDVVIYRAENFLGCNYEGHHLPDCHFKVHLRELEEPLEEARHSQFASAGGGCAAEIGWTACRAW